MTRTATRWGDFERLWAALSVSLMGTEITALALPLLAALTLGASALEMGILAAAGQVPFLLFSLPAGAWIDRLPRRPVLIATDVASSLLLVSVPLAVPFGGPNFPHLVVVAFGVGTMTVVSEVAHYAYVPSLVGRERLTESNSRLRVSYSAAAATGPGLAGALVQLLSAPVAVLADAVSFLISAALLRSIRRPEPAPDRSDARLPVRRSIADGMRKLLGHPLLRAIIVASVPITFFTSGFLALYVLYASRELGLAPATIGLVFAAGGVGAISGAMLARRAADRFGVGPAIIGGWVLAAAGALLVPLAAGPTVVVVVILALSKAFEGITDTVANIHQWSLRQVVTPDHLAGRVTAGHRFAVYGAGAAGALAGGALGTALGLRPALFVCAVGALLSPLPAVFSPLRQLREQPVSDSLTS
ncbi:MAG TPA: MFS transporter [Actinomycetota bacterium]|nr:MFS transporter [Actinomycetota bacterium]